MPKARSFISGFSTKAGGLFGNLALHSVLNAPRTLADYAANRVLPILIPTGGEIINCINHGFIDFESAVTPLRENGINIDRDLWHAVLESGKMYPGIEDTLRAYWRKKITRPVYDRWIAHNGATDRVVRDYVSHQPYHWSPELIRILYRLGAIDSYADYQDWLRSAGMILEEDRSGFESLFAAPPVSELLEMWNRGYIDENVVNQWLALNGLTEPITISSAKKMRHKIPSPSQLVEFSVKEVWNRPIVDKYGYDAEYDQIPQFKAWMKSQGYGGSPDHPDAPIGDMNEWSQAFWRSHWRVVSNEQVYRMMHRLRPAGGPNGTPRMPVVPGTNTAITPVTIDEVRDVLKVNDYPPYWRDKLAALSFNVLRLVDIRRIVRRSIADNEFKKNAIGDGFTILDWAKENFLDRGQTPADAHSLAILAIADADEQLGRSERQKLIAARSRKFRLVLSQYKLGTINRTDAENELAMLEWVGQPMELLLNSVDGEVSLDCVKKNIMLVRNEFRKGRVKEHDAYEMLVFFGITEIRSAQYISCWKAGMTKEHVLETTASTQTALEQGLLTPTQAQEQLANLGWDNADELLTLSQAAAELNGVA